MRTVAAVMPALGLILSSALVALVALVALPAQAAGDRLKLGVFGSGKGSGPLLTRAELRDCLALVERIRSGSESAQSEREQIDRERAEVVRAGAELKSQLEVLDRSNEEAVRQYVERATAHDRRIDALESRTSGFNARVEGLAGERSRYAQRCDNRRFDQADEVAIRAGK